MIVSAIATMSASALPFDSLANSGGRTSSAERRVDITRPAPRGSTRTGRSRRAPRTRARPRRLRAGDGNPPEPEPVLLGHRLADDPECLGRELAVGMDVIGGVEVD